LSFEEKLREQGCVSLEKRRLWRHPTAALGTCRRVMEPGSDA